MTGPLGSGGMGEVYPRFPAWSWRIGANMRSMLVLAVFLSLSAPALAQDPAKVSPETHKVILENDRVRVLEVRVKAGEKVPTHSHPANVVYFLNDAKERFTCPDGKTTDREDKAGVAMWSEAVTHSAENVGTTETHVIQIELAAKRPATEKKKGT